jgi:MFS family permease
LLPVLLNSGLLQGAVYVVRPMVSYKSVDLGADALLVGLVGATFALAPLLFAIQIGRWVDRGFEGRAMVLGSTLALGTTIGLIFVESIPLLILAMPILGIGHLLVMTGGQTMIANRSDNKKYEKNFGLLTFYASLGHAIGPLAGGLLADRGGVNIDVDAAFMFAVLLFIAATAVVIPLFKKSTGKDTLPSLDARSVRRVLTTKGFPSAMFVAGSITAVIDVTLIFLPLLGRELGLSATQVGILLALRAASSMLVRLVLGPTSTRLGMRVTLHSGSVVTFVSVLMIAFVTDFWWLALIMSISGLAMGVGQPVTMAWVSRISSPENRGLAISIRLTSNRFGQVVVPAIAGAIAVGGVGTVFLMLAVLQLASIVVTEKALGAGGKKDQEGEDDSSQS